MKGQQVIIPASLRCKTLETLHSSYMGITKTIEHARRAVFWPNMQKDIITHLSSCRPCAEFKIKQKPEPLSHKLSMLEQPYFGPTCRDIITHLSSCHPCAEFKIKQKPEPLSHDVPMVTWHSLTLDNFEFKGTHYLLVYHRFS